MLHWTKIGFLVLFALILMRLLSWVPMWIAATVVKPVRWKSVLIFNSTALILFVVFLWRETLPGEPFDIAAVIFGMVVYLGFSIADLFWLPWTRSNSGKNGKKNGDRH